MASSFEGYEIVEIREKLRIIETKLDRYNLMRVRSNKIEMSARALLDALALSKMGLPLADEHVRYWQQRLHDNLAEPHP